MNLLAAAVITLHLTHPTKNAGPSGCTESLVPLTDLHMTRVYGTMVGESSRFIVHQKIVSGREGTRDTLRITQWFDHENWLFEVVEVDSAGNESCAKITYWLPTADVPIDHESKVRVEWFDLQGRKLKEHETNVPGVYFWRQGTNRGKRVVLR